jgi:hypothetical protein
LAKLLFPALRAEPVRELRSFAVLADEKPLLFHRQMRTPPANLAFTMMFCWYASHVLFFYSKYILG